MKKIDYKKDMKELYIPGTAPVLVDVPAMNFITVNGEGDPNDQAFAQACEALYSLTYAVKMSYKSSFVPEGYYEYTIFPLEGVWGLIDTSKPIADKSNYKYDIMIRQPDFLMPELFERFLSEVRKKKYNEFLDNASFRSIKEGMCCQMMHLGSYDDEPASFAMMDKYCSEKGYRRSSPYHREIYLTNPQKTEPQKLRTVLRFQVDKVL